MICVKIFAEFSIGTIFFRESGTDLIVKKEKNLFDPLNPQLFLFSNFSFPQMSVWYMIGKNC